MKISVARRNGIFVRFMVIFGVTDAVRFCKIYKTCWGSLGKWRLLFHRRKQNYGANHRLNEVEIRVVTHALILVKKSTKGDILFHFDVPFLKVL